ncbi:uncharacterized protein LOC141688417 [Apium graveolens]|uniref:uncharacterized protein LOC141688417 n=1 Tax=Apium graveolens TaxID=4045 RepID=UPI003D78C9A7
MLFVDDIVLIAESRVEVNTNLEQWCASLEAKGLHLSHSKTEYLWANSSEEHHAEDVVVCIADDRVPQTDSFKYLGSIIKSNGDIIDDVTHLRSTLMYGSECWPLRKAEERGLKTAEMRML